MTAASIAKPAVTVRKAPAAEPKILSRAIDLESLAFRAAAVSDLVEWVVSAHDLIQQIDGSCRSDQVLVERLELHQIRRHQADWEMSRMTDAIASILGYQQELIEEMARGVTA